jgi:hypothetical protein
MQTTISKKKPPQGKPLMTAYQESSYVKDDIYRCSFSFYIVLHDTSISKMHMTAFLLFDDNLSCCRPIRKVNNSICRK